MADSKIKSMADILAAHPLFAGLDAEITDLLGGCATNRHFPDGAYLFKAEEPADDKASFLWMARIPAQLEGADGESLRLVDVELRRAYQVATASPGFNAKDLVYLPFPASMIRERATMVFVYVSLRERRDVGLGEMVQILKVGEEG